MSVPTILYPGDPADLTLSPGDRYEIAESNASDARRLLRRDWDGDPASLTFDPEGATTLVFRLGGRAARESDPYIDYRLTEARVILDRFRRAR